MIATAQLAVLVATSTRYGYHRDELYFIVSGQHPAFGYPDQPPLVPLLSAALHGLAHSLLLLRIPSALIAAATTVVSASIAREVGGTRRAETIAAACTASSGFALAVGHFVTTTTPDLLSTTLFLWLVVRALVRRSGSALLAAGVVVGIGFEAKPQVGIVAAVTAATVVAIGPRWTLRSWWTGAAVLVAVALAAPYLVWQQLHGWPQVAVAHNIGGSAEGGRIGFIPFQLLMVSPVLVPVWIAGLLVPFRRPAFRDLRCIPIAYIVLGVLYLAGNGKAYYLASLYPALLGIGALPAAEWTLRKRGRTGAIAAATVVSALIAGLIALPLLPERQLQGSFPMAVNPDLGETVGWPRFVDTVTRAWRSIPPGERARTAIFTSNYGEAGAVDVLGRSRGLPRAYSGHNGFSEWGEPRASDTSALLIGFDDATDAAPEFSRCRRLARIDDGVGLDNQEQALPVLLCRPTASWASLWPKLRHYD
ncbi:MAG TPA: glycosyltransferase family 39 protein [Gaiellaceae bacterium]|nr:glycosyltransferase family 39 protein [Gaiellaceae bacterium]